VGTLEQTEKEALSRRVSDVFSHVQTSRLLQTSGRAVGYTMGILGVWFGIFTILVAHHPPVGVTWAAAYAQFLAGETSLSVGFLLRIAFLLFPLALLHAVYSDTVGFLTFAPAIVLLRVDPVVPVDAGGFPLLGLFVSGSVPVPIWAVVVGIAAAWNVEERLAPEADGVPPTDTEHSGQYAVRWRRLGGAVGGYTLVGACCLVGVARTVGVLRPPAPLLGIGFLAFGAIVYEFVATGSHVGTGTLAVGAWATGLAGLQYNGAVPGVAVPAAVLLTLAAAGLWLDEWERRPRTDLDTPDSLRKS